MKTHRALLASLSLALVACSSGDPQSPTQPGPDTNATYTFYRDVKPILDTNCVSCHQPGQIGVGDFTDPELVTAQAGIISAQVTAGIMPPWLADGECNEYQDDRRLSQHDIDVIATWADEGGAMGDPADDPKLKPADPVVLPRVDYELALPVAYEPDNSVEDDYRCFAIDWPATSDTYVTGFGVRPGNTSTVHHVIAYYVPPSKVAEIEALDDADPAPGYPCFGGPGGQIDQNIGFFGAWAPGTQDVDFTNFTGIKMVPGSKVIVQMHYNTVTWDGAPDQTSVAVKVDDSVTVEGKFQFFADPSWVLSGTMDIPAGNPDVFHETAFDISSFFAGGNPFTIWSAGLHMHTRGTSAKLAVQRQGGGETCVLDIPRWDFNWQFGYQLKSPIHYEPGDKLYLGCHFDNSTENQPTVNGMPMAPEDLAWGDGTNDEMCLGLIYMTVDG